MKTLHYFFGASLFVMAGVWLVEANWFWFVWDLVFGTLNILRWRDLEVAK